MAETWLNSCLGYNENIIQDMECMKFKVSWFVSARPYENGFAKHLFCKEITINCDVQTLEPFNLSQILVHFLTTYCFSRLFHSLLILLIISFFPLGKGLKDVPMFEMQKCLVHVYISKEIKYLRQIRLPKCFWPNCS